MSASSSSPAGDEANDDGANRDRGKGIKPARLDLERRSPDTLSVRISGEWRGLSHVPPVDAAEATIRSDRHLDRITFDARALAGWDSVLLAVLLRIARAAEQHAVRLDRSGLPEGAVRLLDLAFASPELDDVERTIPRAPSGPAFVPVALSRPLAHVGLVVTDLVEHTRDGLTFLGQAVLAVRRFAMGRAQVERDDVWLMIQRCGADALPIVTLISALVGLILAFVGAMQLRTFGVEIYTADLVAIGMTREMGATMAAVIMAGRSGGAFAAQIGTMRVREEIDALQTLGISPMDFLVLPRMLALVLMMPLLCLYADFLGILGGAVVSITSFGLTPAQYWSQTQHALDLSHIGVGVFKSAIFGGVVALSACLRGMECGRSASAVGDAATSAVVTGIVWIVLSDALITLVTTIVGI